MPTTRTPKSPSTKRTTTAGASSTAPDGRCFRHNTASSTLYKQEADGKVYAGAVDYKGQVRIPFIYDENRDDVYHHQEFVPFEKKGKVGFVSINGGRVTEPFEYVSCKAHAYGWLVSKDGKNYGFVSSKTGTLAVPLKYSGFWEEGPALKRFDGKIDYYDENFRLIRTADAPKD